MTADVELLPLPKIMQGKAIADIAMRYARANVLHHTAAQAAEIARLTEAFEFQSALTKNLLPYQDEAVASRAEIEALRAELDRVLGEHVRKRRALAKAEARAERLAEALREAKGCINSMNYPGIIAGIDALLREQRSGVGLNELLAVNATAPETKMESLAQEFPKEQQRVRKLLGVYNTIPTGAFGAMMLRQVLTRAEQAAASGDVIAMLRSYEELKGCQ